MNIDNVELMGNIFDSISEVLSPVVSKILPQVQSIATQTKQIQQTVTPVVPQIQIVQPSATPTTVTPANILSKIPTWVYIAVPAGILGVVVLKKSFKGKRGRR